MAVQYFLEDAGNVNCLFSVSCVKKVFLQNTGCSLQKVSAGIVSRMLLINFINLLSMVFLFLLCGLVAGFVHF